MSNKPLVLLDIDGVISPNGRIDKNIEIRTIKNEYGRWVIPLLNLKFIKVLSELAEVVWLSTWQEHSNAINKFIKIEDFNISSNLYKSDKISTNKIKEDEIKNIRKLYPDRKIIVIDDDEVFSRFATLNIIPNPLIGLNLTEMRNVLKEVNDSN